MFLILTLVKAWPLPGFTNWNSTTEYGWSSTIILRPLRMSLVSIGRASCWREGPASSTTAPPAHPPFPFPFPFPFPKPGGNGNGNGRGNGNGSDKSGTPAAPQVECRPFSMIPTPQRPLGTRPLPADDHGDELRDIKREIVESRGLIIKTNNLTNALAADLKSISKRQIGFEKRAFWNSAGANLLFVVIVIGVVKLAWDARIDAVSAETSGTKQKIAKLEKDLDDTRRRADERTRAEGDASAFYELIREGRRQEVIDGFEAVRQKPLSRAEIAFFT